MMSLGQSASELQNGHSDTGSRVSTKNPASGFSGGAIKPRISTGLPLSAVSLSDSSRPRTPEALYISSKRSVSPAQAIRGGDTSPARLTIARPAIARKLLRGIAGQSHRPPASRSEKVAPLRPSGGKGRGPARVSLRPTDLIRGDGRVRWARPQT